MTAELTIAVPEPGQCDCGDPDCVYVANLAAEVEWLQCTFPTTA